jgi:hypothetical protein
MLGSFERLLTILMCECGQMKCRVCRGRRGGRRKRRYFWTPALDAMLREVYLAREKSTRAAGLKRMAAQAKIPHRRLTHRAHELGIASPNVRTRRREWTAEETEFLREAMGRQSAEMIAKRLGRSRVSVLTKTDALRLSLKIRDGYSVADVAEVMGAPRGKVEGWIRRGLLGRPRDLGGMRVSEKQLVEFLRRYTSEYDLRRVDQGWFVSVIFGGDKSLCRE